MLSKRIMNMVPSITVGLTDKIEELNRKGIDIIRMNIGEPDFNTPDNINEAAKRALDEGFTKYTAVSGTYGLREAIAEKLYKDNNISYKVNEIIVSVGAKQALTNTLMTLVNEDDEVILPIPCWVSYIEMVKLAGGKPVLVNTKESEGFSLDLEGIKKSITNKTKAIIINTPNNPTGSVYGENELRELGELAVKEGFYIISDEIYEKLIYEGDKHKSMASLSSDIKDITITINGFSKAYSMTGWRVGYAAGRRELIKGMTDLQGHMTSATNSIAQVAALEALKGDQASVSVMANEFAKRRSFLLKQLNSIEGVKCNNAKGAFYLMPDISYYYNKRYDNKVIKDSVDLAEFLLEKAHVAVVPGIAFNAPNYIRIAYSNSMEKLTMGVEGIAKALGLLV